MTGMDSRMRAVLIDYLPIVVMARARRPVRGRVARGLLGRFGPTSRPPVKLSAYECGNDPVRLPRGERFSVKFYVVAMLFIIFDIETIFLFPWAVTLPSARPVRARRRWRSSSRWCSWPTSTSGARAGSTGRAARSPRSTRRPRAHAGEPEPEPEEVAPCRLSASRASSSGKTPEEIEEEVRRGVLLTIARPGGGLGSQAVDVAGDVRPGVLRDRDDVDRRRQVRPVAVGDGAVPRLAAPGRPDDRGRSRVAEDGAGPAADLRPDARAASG